jgi:hypothetical protein
MRKSKHPDESPWWAVGVILVSVALMAYFVWAMQDR